MLSCCSAIEIHHQDLFVFFLFCRFFLVIASLVLTVLSTVETRDKKYELILQTPILVVVSVVNFH